MLLSSLLSQGLQIYYLLLAILVVGVVAAISSLYILYVPKVNPLRSIPGPFFASITKLWVVKQQRGGQMHRVDMALHRKHGPIIRNAPNKVLISNLQSL